MSIWGSNGSKGKKRKPLSAYDKQTVLARQNYKCAGCDNKFTASIRPHYDHKTPISSGGTNNVSNIRAICANCHDDKTRKEHRKRAKAKTQTANDPFGLRNIEKMYGSSNSVTRRKKKQDSFWF